MTGFQYFLRALQISWIGLRQLGGLLKTRLLKHPGPSGPERLRQTLEQMSGSFLKFGQILSLQVDVLPREYCDALLNLLDRVPPFSAENVKQVFIEELGSSPESLFRRFDYVPIASASIGQVHRAVLDDSTEVAVKVQRPGIREVFRRDAVLLNAFVKLAFFLRIQSLYFIRDPVREFNDWIRDELDYRREASHADMLRKNAEAMSTERVPRIYWNFTTGRILTMDFLQGFTVLEYLRLGPSQDKVRIQEMEATGFNPSVFVSNVVTNFVSDALRFGVFHADLHPANLVILEGNVVGYVDFGIVGSLTPEARRKTIKLTLAYVRGRNEEIYSSFMEISKFTRDADLAGFRRELEMRSRTWYKEPAIGGVAGLGKSVTVALMDMLALCRSHGILPNREMIKYIRSLMLADGLISRLAPGLDLAPQLADLCEDYMRRDVQRRLLSSRSMLMLLADFSGWLQAGPGALLHSLDLMERRQFRIQAHLSQKRKDDDAAKIRSALMVIVWLAVFVSLLVRWEDARLQALPFIFAVTFLGFWTFWLVRHFRRLLEAGN